jgi:hypothetical protein
MSQCSRKVEGREQGVVEPVFQKGRGLGTGVDEPVCQKG